MNPLQRIVGTPPTYAASRYCRNCFHSSLVRVFCLKTTQARLGTSSDFILRVAKPDSNSAAHRIRNASIIAKFKSETKERFPCEEKLTWNHVLLNSGYRVAQQVQAFSLEYKRQFFVHSVFDCGHRTVDVIED
jgi:hypothetical protein